MRSALALLSAALLPGLAATPSIAQADGFTSQHLAESARSLTGEAGARAQLAASVASRSEDLRQALAVDQARLAAILGSSELRALTAAMGPPTVDRDILLSWFARGGHVAVAGTDLAGIYNPFVDGWLVLRWQQVGGRPRLVAAALVSGQPLRGASPAFAGEADMPFAQALVARRLRSLAAFEQLTGEFGSEALFRAYHPVRVAESERVLEQARQQVGALAQWSRSQAGDLGAVNRLIAAGDDPALATVPQRLRRDLGLIALAQTPAGTELVLQAPLAPTRSIIATLPRSGNALPHLFAIDLAPTLIGSAAQ